MATTKLNPYLIDDENPEWTAEDFKNARTAREVLHEIFSKEVADEILSPKPGRKLGRGVKDSQNIRFDP